MGCKVGELYDVGSARPREQGTLRHTLELLLSGSLQSPASQKSRTYLELGFGSPRNRAQHSTTQHITSHQSTSQNTTQHSRGDTVFLWLWGGKGGGKGRGRGLGGGGRGFVSLLSLTQLLPITPLPHQKRQSDKARKRQSKRKCEAHKKCNNGEVVHPAILVTESLRGVKLQDVKVWALQRPENRGTLIHTLKKHLT